MQCRITCLRTSHDHKLLGKNSDTCSEATECCRAWYEVCTLLQHLLVLCRAYAILQKEAQEEQRYLSKVPGWNVDEPVSATGRYIPPPTPAGIWDPSVQ